MRSAAIVGAVSVLFTGGACRELTPEPPRDRPRVELTAPGEGQELAFDAPFVISGRAIAPEGAELLRALVVLGGATSISRTIELGGAEQRFDLALTVPSDRHLGADRLPLEARITAIARVDGLETESELLRLDLVVVDRSAPELTIELAPPGDPLAGFDTAYPPATPFVLTARAHDPTGGVVQLEVIAPPVLGGARSLELPPSFDAELVVAFDPPQNGDLEIFVRARDAAAQSNLTERTVRIRIGAGGDDRTAPAVLFLTPATAECGTDLLVNVAATDDASGMERLELHGEGVDARVFGPNPASPLALVLNATVAVPRDRPLGSTLSFDASARDLAGNTAPARAYEPSILDTLPPSLTAVLGQDTAVIPGSLWSATFIGSERCRTIEEAVALFTSVDATTATIAAPIASETVNGRVSFLVPPNVCTLGPILTEVSLIDSNGLDSAPVRFSLFGSDVLPPNVAIGTSALSIAPGGSLDVEVAMTDLQTPIATGSVSLIPLALDLPSPVLSTSSSFPSADCADRGERMVSARYQVPADVRFLAADGALHVEAIALDAAGNQRRVFLDVPVVDTAPPSVAFLSPAAGAIATGNAPLPLVIAAADLNHDVESISVTVFGPASLGAAGASSATIAIGAASSTVGIDLLVDAGAPLDTPIRVVARARDSGFAAPVASTELILSTCGAPAASSLTPALGPAGGDVEVLIFGSGFAPDGAFSAALGAVALESIAVEGSTIARARVPAGDYEPGLVDLIVRNDCAGTAASAVLQDAFRFVAPPIVELVRPADGATAIAGAELPVTVGAIADAVTLVSIEARIAGSPSSAWVSPNAGSGTLDGVLSVPDAASGSITVIAEAIDALGQSASASVDVEITPPAPLAIELFVERAELAVGETLGYAVLAEDSDQRAREVTALVSITSSSTSAIDVDGAGRIYALAPGRAVLTARFGALEHSIEVRASDRALVFAHGPVLLGLPPSSPAAVEVLLLEDGITSIVDTDLVSTSSAVAVSGRLIFGTVSGDAELIATFDTLTATLAVRARDQFDVGASETWFVAGEQTFSGGSIEGRAIALRPAVELGEWRTAISGGGSLRIAESGVLDARGAPGWASGNGGRGAHGAGGGGASTAFGGASGGFGEPSGEDTAGDGDNLTGGNGARIAAGGGEGAHAIDGSSGAGGGAFGAGGDGAGGSLGGVGTALLAGGNGGGGGRRGGGGGGGGARVVFALGGASLIIDGLIDASGGAGGYAASPGTGGGGGGGGAIILEARELLGRGTLRARGGAPSGTGGAGGGGSIVFDSSGARSPFLAADVEGASRGRVLR